MRAEQPIAKPFLQNADERYQNMSIDIDDNYSPS